MEPTNPTAYILCYTIILDKNKSTESNRSFFEVFARTNPSNENPLQQAQRRLQETKDFCNDKTKTIGELFTWNICKVAETSEHYATEGKQVNTTIYPAAQVPDQWDNIEVEAIKEDEVMGCSRTFGEGEADFHSVYLHNTEGGSMCIADCETEEQANELAETLKRIVLQYKNNGYL
jgi:hypothetical protein